MWWPWRAMRGRGTGPWDYCNVLRHGVAGVGLQRLGAEAHRAPQGSSALVEYVRQPCDLPSFLPLHIPYGQTLRRKAEERNPDEFYFAMEKARTKDGVHDGRWVHAWSSVWRRNGAHECGLGRHRGGLWLRVML